MKLERLDEDFNNLDLAAEALACTEIYLPLTQMFKTHQRLLTDIARLDFQSCHSVEELEKVRHEILSFALNPNTSVEAAAQFFDKCAQVLRTYVDTLENGTIIPIANYHETLMINKSLNSLYYGEFLGLKKRLGSDFRVADVPIGTIIEFLGKRAAEYMKAAVENGFGQAKFTEGSPDVITIPQTIQIQAAETKNRLSGTNDWN